MLSNMAGNATEKVVPCRSHAEFGKKPGSYHNLPSSFMKKGAKSFSVPNLAEVRKTNP